MTDPSGPDLLSRNFDTFYRQELPAMVALAAAVTGNNLVAEDLAQEAMVRAYRRWDDIGRYDKPGAWLRRVTINLALSTRKRAAAEVKARLGLGRPVSLDANPSHLDGVWDAVGRLPRQQRAAVALHYLEDRSVAEISEILDCSESTARVHLHRGRTTLASLLEGAA